MWIKVCNYILELSISDNSKFARELKVSPKCNSKVSC